MKSIEEYQRFVSAVSELTGQGLLSSDDRGLVSVTVDGRLNLNLQYAAATEKVLCFVEIAQIPANAPVELYRDLLAAGLFGQETAGGYFSLEKFSGTVVYNYVFDGECMHRAPEEFVEQLENILQFCELWADRIGAALRDGEQDQRQEQSESFPFYDIPV